MKVIIILLLSFQTLVAQNTFVQWISSENDEIVTELIELENNNFFFSYLEFSENENKTINYYIVADQDFNILNEIQINSKCNFQINSCQVIKTCQDSILLWGNATDSISGEKQLFIACLDSELNILHDSLIGLPIRDDHMQKGIYTQSEKFLFYKWEVIPNSKDDEIIFFFLGT